MTPQMIVHELITTTAELQALCDRLRDAPDPEAFAATSPGEPGYVHNFFFLPVERPCGRRP